MALRKKTTAATAGIVLAVGALSALPAQAADLGGNCCADLEERIAELEATTARKGNRKVSLTVSGWVAQQIVNWDDGVESNTYLTGLGTAFASNVNFTGRAQITNDVSAGYVLHIELIDSDVYSTNANRANGPGVTGSPNSAQVHYSYWFLKSNTYGQVSVGKQSQADDNVVVSLDSSGTLAAAYWVGYDVFGFNVRGNFAPGQSMIWGNASSCRGWGGGPGDCDGLPRNVVRYDTPAIAGFSGAVSWGEDDEWSVLGRYSGNIGDVKVALAASYGETNDPNLGATFGGKLKYTQAGIYLQHMPTGIFGTAGYGHLTETANLMNNPDTDTWYFKGGVRLKMTPIGATIPYGEYLGANNSAMINDSITDTSQVVEGSSTTWWGVGVVQEIDAAAMSVWLRYRDHSVDVPGVDTKDMSTIVAGAMISF
ncbi:porin [Hyphomicrobium methylovorum]|uniref:porin n=1 Tax=Hyphomicrobium methylovorum TaxID=84 RepID=UPI0015E6C6A6|nr:porin [Hyphomicrobium methylovorum]MBA2125179.1 porin [Hyphomicrobium methylovorum]